MTEPAQILVVDDSMTVRMDLGDALTEAGFNVDTAATIAEARALATPGRYRLVILDVLLPDGDGIDLLREWRSQPSTRDMVVLLLSSESEVRDRLRGLDTGADEYLGKPYDLAYLCDRAGELLGADAPRSPSTAPLVLLIEDSETFSQAARAHLESVGYQVLVAASGDEGLRLAERRHPDAVVIDGVLPDIDGAGVVRRLRLHPDLRTVPLVLLTGTVGSIDEIAGLDAGADVYLTKGASFDLLQARLAALLRSVAGSHRAAAGAQRKRLLAVDDSPTYLNHLAEELRGEGYDVALADSGESALRFLEVQPVDAVLVDLMMPGMSGLEVCREIKANSKLRGTPVVILTARQENESVITGLNAGADDYIVKSQSLDVLRGRLAAQLRRKQFEDENRRVQDELHAKEVELAEARAAQSLAEARAQLLADLERKNAELERAREIAEAANRFKSDFLATMSHEIRTPMNAILGFTDLLIDEERDSSKRETLQIVRNAGTALLTIINDILDFSKIEAGRLELSLHEFEPRELLQRIRDLFGLRAKERSLRFEVIADDSLPARLVGDDQRLFQLLCNLVGNALKFTESGFVRVDAGYAGARLRVAVSDSGIGIDPAHQSRLFTPFEQADRSTTRRFGGTGLGLAICKNLAGLMGGEIGLESEPGKGSTFRLSIPLTEPLMPTGAPARAPRRPVHRGHVWVLAQAGQPAPATNDWQTLGFSSERVDLSQAPPRGFPTLAWHWLDPGSLRPSRSLLSWLLALHRRQPPLLLHSRDGSRRAALMVGVLPEDNTPLDNARRTLALFPPGAQPRVLLLHDADTAADAQACAGLLSALDAAVFCGDAATEISLPRRCDAVLLLAALPGEATHSWLRGLLAGHWAPAFLLTPAAWESLPPLLAGSASAQPRWATARRTLTALRLQAARRHAAGELFRAWQERQPLAELAALVTQCLPRLLPAISEIGRLATSASDAPALVSESHGLAGWSGTLRMDEVYQPARRLESLAENAQPDWTAIRADALRLLRVADVLAPLATAAPVPPTENGAATQFRLLVVEDNPMNQQLLQRLLEKFGMPFDQAWNGAEALERLAERRYAGVLLDMEMPVMDGRQTIQAIRNNPEWSTLHVIALTAHAVVGAGERFLAAGCDDYLSKPFEPSHLQRKLVALRERVSADTDTAD